jgi:hypothetical protein
MKEAKAALAREIDRSAAKEREGDEVAEPLPWQP